MVYKDGFRCNRSLIRYFIFTWHIWKNDNTKEQDIRPLIDCKQAFDLIKGKVLCHNTVYLNLLSSRNKFCNKAVFKLSIEIYSTNYTPLLHNSRIKNVWFLVIYFQVCSGLWNFKKPRDTGENEIYFEIYLQFWYRETWKLFKKFGQDGVFAWRGYIHSASTTCAKTFITYIRVTVPARDVLASDVFGTGIFRWHLLL